MEVGLVEAIRSLRNELIDAMTEAKDEQIRFRVESVDLELNVAVEKKAEAGGGVKFWVASIGGKGSHSSTATHTLKLHLEARTSTGEEVFTRDTLDSIPE
ncbi:trypco2 family protein [Streptomyces sp. NPDC002688]|uniref:trypco2 family protein n=1 Tax=Streptomyces sp. NPDC002688 TaxID=3154423 RepID=UPI0033338B41